MLTNKSVTDLLNAFSSPDPTPGGGSASALAGALGTSLLAMVAGMPKTKTGTPEARVTLDHAHTRLLELRATLVDLVDRDAAAYDLVVAAYKQPKATDEEKAARKAAIQEAFRVATKVPIETIRACTEAVHAATAVAEHGNANATSDIAVGIQLLGTATQGALFNVEINMPSLTDQDTVRELTHELQALFKHSRKDFMQVYQSAGLVELMKQAATRAGQLTAEERHDK